MLDKMNEKTVAIIQARMGSTRLPNKVLKEISGKPLIWHIIERAKLAKNIDQIIVATSTNDLDTPLYDYLTSIDVLCIRGSEDDVLSRYYTAASDVGADIIVRLTGDNPLIDYKMLDDAIEYYHKSGLPYVSTIDVPTINKPIPLGVGCEVFSYELLKEAHMNAMKSYEREHVTPYMYLDKIKTNRSEIIPYSFRLTVDTIEDFSCISMIYELLYHGKHDFCTDEIIECLLSNLDIAIKNADIIQKKLGE